MENNEGNTHVHYLFEKAGDLAPSHDHPSQSSSYAMQVNWPAINFVDPGPPPRGRKKPPGFFDEYQPSSEEDEEEEEDKKARKSIAEGFYGKSSRTTRSSTALPSSNKHNSGGSRAAGLVEMARTGAVDIEALEEEGLPERERARKARHAGRGMTKVIFVMRSLVSCFFSQMRACFVCLFTIIHY